MTEDRDSWSNHHHDGDLFQPTEQSSKKPTKQIEKRLGDFGDASIPQAISQPTTFGDDPSIDEEDSMAVTQVPTPPDPSGEVEPNARSNRFTLNSTLWSMIAFVSGLLTVFIATLEHLLKVLPETSSYIWYATALVFAISVLKFANNYLKQTKEPRTPCCCMTTVACGLSVLGICSVLVLIGFLVLKKHIDRSNLATSTATATAIAEPTPEPVVDEPLPEVDIVPNPPDNPIPDLPSDPIQDCVGVVMVNNIVSYNSISALRAGTSTGTLAEGTQGVIDRRIIVKIEDKDVVYLRIKFDQQTEWVIANALTTTGKCDKIPTVP